MVVSSPLTRDIGNRIGALGHLLEDIGSDDIVRLPPFWATEPAGPWTSVPKVFAAVFHCKEPQSKNASSIQTPGARRQAVLAVASRTHLLKCL